ncbi:hypothetical protein Mp_7g12430 [Marchantia polymorpha subsp. ruderalis]|uniref:Uncharacterized protein n=2 Tax=Marchantia polymorpha TaxID=3197 RepID=A0AAF6BYS3_MARPO|nr:hypothetical protein MARPO_0003s0252 [Marchantia polymorpha]BBN17157.1 hypothetical protein Mp_7g12430 [Marchantia polymorpha subsp. ruderalis]|eukprot:PTQ49392.1 hypothetical protein MARPO_0003s0252 [Marchantia polymorpha]
MGSRTFLDMSPFPVGPMIPRLSPRPSPLASRPSVAPRFLRTETPPKAIPLLPPCLRCLRAIGRRSPPGLPAGWAAGTGAGAGAGAGAGGERGLGAWGWGLGAGRSTYVQQQARVVYAGRGGAYCAPLDGGRTEREVAVKSPAPATTTQQIVAALCELLHLPMPFCPTINAMPSTC